MAALLEFSKKIYEKMSSKSRAGEPYIAYPIYCNILQYMQYFHILLPEANIAICMVCQANIAIIFPRLRYIVILEAKQATITIYRYIGDKLEFSISY